MKGILLWLFIICCTSFLLCFLISTPSYVLVSFGKYTIETRLWSVILCVILLSVVLVIFKLALSVFCAFVRLFTNAFITTNKDCIKRIEKGIISLINGDSKKAYNHFSQATQKEMTNLIATIASAYTAIKNKNYDIAKTWLHKSIIKYSNSSDTADILLARIYLSQQQPTEALALLQKLKNEQPNNVTVLSMLKETYILLRKWWHLLDILPTIHKLAYLPQDEFDNLEYKVIDSIFADILNKHNHHGPIFKNILPAKLSSVWDRLPKKYKKDHLYISIYTCSLIKAKANALAAEIIEKYLRKKYSKELIIIYNKLNIEFVDKQLLLIEFWQDKLQNDHELLVVLGDIYFKNKLWGKARGCFEQSINIQPTATAYKKIADILMIENLQDEAIKYFNNAFDVLQKKENFLQIL